MGWERAEKWEGERGRKGGQISWKSEHDSGRNKMVK